jgi:hypothetical protein
VFSEEVQAVLHRYELKQLTSAEVVERLVEIAKRLRDARRRHEQLEANANVAYGREHYWWPASENGSAAELVVKSADLSRARPPRWAWQDRIAIGYLNLLLGNEGVGKGTLIAWMVAGWTCGALEGFFDGPISVGLLGDEDSFDDVWTPRLHAAGADLERVKQIERSDGDVVHIRDDRDKLAEIVQEHGIQVLIYDQLLDNLDFDTKSGYQQKTIRAALRPVQWLARELGVAVIGSLHPNKRGASFRELVSGSVAFNAVSRSSLLLAEHPQDEERRVLVRGKGNLSKIPSIAPISCAAGTVAQGRAPGCLSCSSPLRSG